MNFLRRISALSYLFAWLSLTVSRAIVRFCVSNVCTGYTDVICQFV